MKRTYTALQALHLIFDLVEEERDEAEPAEEEEEEEVSEGDEEEPPENKDIVQSKDGNILWSSIPPSNQHLSTTEDKKSQIILRSSTLS
ncbi:hypothetical protein KOW79_022389 [Hemibagrus wyckioides]|uniref:Uncharacterized protein n=1 Tax=Hemibagrus wyckioides TaxID=337641 RepID=A0A9D3SBF7_9TELE|nr:hypothetical protein KOW79_022389 [Hemibagrus wyckioides]